MATKRTDKCPKCEMCMKCTQLPGGGCYKSLEGKYGQMRSEVLHPLKVDQPFTLYASNWVDDGSTSDARYTFLKGKDGSIETVFNVTVNNGTPSLDLEDTFQFVFKKEGCANSSKIIHYGDKVQLYCLGSKKYIQCGRELGARGSCSGVSDSGGCKPGKWQTFIVTNGCSAVAKKTGPVCFGDCVRIHNVVWNLDITPAGAKGVWATLPGTNSNAILTILPKTGCMYADCTKQNAQHAAGHQKRLCANNPYAIQCTAGAIGKFFANLFSFRNVMIMITVLLVVIIILYFVYKIRTAPISQ